ncbi:reactive intermediate/imine deaminase [Halobacteriales archaeon SW_7_68_16]|nr:MAG: reactive intermediate/imine deaminase [Halobacteriales archaeon SW_7_68_16]
MRRSIATDDAPAAVGAYSQAMAHDGLLFTAGQIPMTPDGEVLADAPIERQTERALDNVLAILDEAGLTAADVLKTTVYLDDVDEFEAMNATYATYFDADPPARSAVEVAALPRGVGVEIEAIAADE